MGSGFSESQIDWLEGKGKEKKDGKQVRKKQGNSSSEVITELKNMIIGI